MYWLAANEIPNLIWRFNKFRIVHMSLLFKEIPILRFALNTSSLHTTLPTSLSHTSTQTHVHSTAANMVDNILWKMNPISLHANKCSNNPSHLRTFLLLAFQQPLSTYPHHTHTHILHSNHLNHPPPCQSASTTI